MAQQINKDLIDPAALRTGRLDYQVEIPKPGRIQRAELFKVCFQDRPLEANMRYDSLANLSDGFTASDITFVVNKAALVAAKGNLLISTEIILKCISEVQADRMKSLNIPMRDDKIEE